MGYLDTATLFVRSNAVQIECGNGIERTGGGAREERGERERRVGEAGMKEGR
jgi:hypothetical protein